MPKIVENLRARAIQEARPILTAPEYTTFTMRGVAAACAVAAGTLYNYFLSKEYLIGCVVLEDWQAAVDEMMALDRGAHTIEQVVERLYTAMCRFAEAHQYLAAFDIWGGKDGFDYADRHILLRRQIEALLALLETRFGAGPDSGVTTFLEECVKEAANLQRKAAQYQQRALDIQKRALLRNLTYD